MAIYVPKEPRVYYAIERRLPGSRSWRPAKGLPLGPRDDNLLPRPDRAIVIDGVLRPARHFDRYVKFQPSGAWGIPSSQRNAAAKADILFIARWLREHAKWRGEMRVVHVQDAWSCVIAED